MIIIPYFFCVQIFIQQVVIAPPTPHFYMFFILELSDLGNVNPYT